MTRKTVSVGGISCGADDLVLISGPCVIEAEDLMLRTAEHLKSLSVRHRIPLIFKSSFIKDNRSSLGLYYGPGLEEGLRILERIKREFELPILSDVHTPDQVPAAAEVLDVIQVPAFLCMQTSLLVACAQTGKPINLKRGQFIAPDVMAKPVQKLVDAGNDQVILTERGYVFGYNDLIVDPRSFYLMGQTGYPVVFDATHSIRRYGIPSADPTGGNRAVLPVLTRAAVAAGVDGLFIEVHPQPEQALCDAATQLPLQSLERFLLPLLELHALVRPHRWNSI